MNLRDYQLLAVDGTYSAWTKHQTALVVMPTGTGKTVVFSEIIRLATKERRLPGQWMVIAHREELVRQAAAKLEACGLNTQIEMADQRAELSMLRRPDVVVASIQTLVRRGLRFKPHEFAGVIIDEAHHYTSASWRAYVEHLKQNADLRILGVTATPDRADNVGVGHVFGNTPAYVLGIEDAIRGGWLVPIEQLPINIEGLDFSGCRTTAGDLNGRDLAEVMSAEKVLHQIATATLDRAGGRKTIVFAPPGFKTGEGGDSFRVSERLNELLNRYKPRCSAIISDRTDKDARREILKDFAEKRIQFIVNVGVLTEGFDAPDIELVVMARPTKSRALYAQMIGRGTRPLPGVVDGPPTAEQRKAAIAGSAKKCLEVLDFVGVCGRHKLVTTTEILAGSEPPEVVDLANKIIRKSGRAMDVRVAVEEAKQTLADKKAKADAEARRRAEVKAKVKYTVGTAIDPFNVLDVRPERRIDTLRSQPASGPQKQMLERMGVKFQPDLTLRDAARLITSIIERRKAGLCTYKQAVLLQRHGHDTSNMTFAEASEKISELIKRHTKPAPFDMPMPEAVA